MTVTRTGTGRPVNKGCGTYTTRIVDTFATVIADAGERTAAIDIQKWDEGTLYIDNGSEDEIVVTLEASDTSDFADSYTLPNPLTLATTVKDYMTLSNYHPFIRAFVNPTGSATSSGTVTLTWCFQTKGSP